MVLSYSKQTFKKNLDLIFQVIEFRVIWINGLILPIKKPSLRNIKWLSKVSQLVTARGRIIRGSLLSKTTVSFLLFSMFLPKFFIVSLSINIYGPLL